MTPDAISSALVRAWVLAGGVVFAAVESTLWLLHLLNPDMPGVARIAISAVAASTTCGVVGWYIHPRLLRWACRLSREDSGAVR